MGNLVGAGASLGIVASLLVAMLGQARYLCVVSRAHLVPLWLAKVHPSTGTPINATIFLGKWCCNFAVQYATVSNVPFYASTKIVYLLLILQFVLSILNY